MRIILERDNDILLCLRDGTGVLDNAAGTGLTHINVDGIVIATDRVATPGPNGADLWWSGEHKHHGGNVQVISAPDGWPLWVSDVRPGREHDMTCARTHGIIATLAAARDMLPTLADLGYEGAADVIRVPVKKKRGQARLSDDQHTYNKVLRGLRGVGERANALLTVTFKALRRVSLDPWRIGQIVRAALVLLRYTASTIGPYRHHTTRSSVTENDSVSGEDSRSHPRNIRAERMKDPVETIALAAVPRRRMWPALLTLFVLAPILGEVFSTSTPPLTFLLDPSTLLWECALYGSGAILIREIVRRRGLGWWHMLLLGAAYGVLEEGIYIQSWYNPHHPIGMGDYGRLWDTSWVWATELTIFHAVFSITIPVILTEALYPQIAERPWLGRKGMWGFALLLTSVTSFAFWYYGFVASSKQGYTHPPVAILGAVLLMVGLFLAGVLPRPFTLPALSQDAPSLWKVRVAGFLFTVTFFTALYGLSGIRVPPLIVIAAMIGVAALAGWKTTRWSRCRGWDRRHRLALASGAFSFWFIFSLIAFASGLPLVSLIFLALLIWLAYRTAAPASHSPPPHAQ